MYKVKLIKDGKGRKAGDIMNPMDFNSYKALYDLGLIEDEHKLIKVKTETKKKEKKVSNNNNKN